MSRYYRRNNNGNAIWIFIVTLVCVAAVILGAVFHTELGNWAKKLKDKLTEDKKQEQVEDKDDGTTVDEDWQGFYFERQAVKYGSWMDSNTMAMHARYVFSEEKYQEIVNNENSFVCTTEVTYSKYKEAVEEYGTLGKYLDYYFSTKTSALDSRLSKRTSNLPERYADEYGRFKYMYSLNDYVFKDYSELNTRRVNVGVIATKEEDGTYSFEYMKLQPGQSYESWDVMTSPVYLASRYLNVIFNSEAIYNADVERMCEEVVSKGVAQAKGVSEEDYVAGEHSLEIDTSEKLQLKVGETKQLVVPITPNIGVQIMYNSVGYNGGVDSAPTHYGYVTVTESGAVTALKAGKCSIGVMIAGANYYFEVEITE